MSESTADHRPPAFADRFLGWFCKDELLEEVKGDLHEFYRWDRESYSVFRAKLNYWYHVINFLRPFAIRGKRQKFNSTVMYKSYIKTGFRNVRRQKLASFINVFGLAVTIAISLVVYSLLETQYTLDNFHKDAKRTFAIQTRINWNGRDEIWGRSPLLLGPSLDADVPQVEAATRVLVTPAVVRFEDKVFREAITFADPSFLDVFTFPVLEGNANSLEGKSNIILSTEAALKYFNDVDVIGKELKLVIDGKDHFFLIGAVAEEFPRNASFQFDFLVPFSNVEAMMDFSLSEWSNVRDQSVYTFVRLDDRLNSSSLNATLEKYKEVSNEINQDWPIEGFYIQELLSMGRNGQFVREAYAQGSTPQILIMFGIISVLLLISACFNYVNIAVSMAQKRLSEIAIRKVVGGQRKQLIVQFLTENFIVCFMATVLGAFLAAYFFLPGINAIFFGANYYINIIEDPFILLFLLVIFVVLGLASGAYPALYISKFKPVEILKGRMGKAKRNGLSKFFLTAQFFLTFTAIISGLLFTSVNEFQADQDWGYDAENLLTVPVTGEEQFNVMREFAAQSPRLEAWAGTNDAIGKARHQQAIRILEEQHTVRLFEMSAEYLEQLKVDFVRGRGFDASLITDKKNIIVNEQFIKKIKPSDLIEDDLKVEFDNEEFNIIGVVKDFRFDSFFEPLEPAIFKMRTENFSYIAFKTVGQNIYTTEEMVKAEWSQRFPDTPYTGFLQLSVFDQFFREIGALKKVMNAVAYIAILLSATGLFGLASLIIFRKIKEFSIRKVLGAKGLGIAALASRQFFVLMALAMVLALPLSYFGFGMLFKQIFPDSLDGLSLVPFAVSIFIMAGVIIITISAHIIQLLRTNPVKNLRLE